LYPLFGTLITGGIIVWVIGTPIAAVMEGLTSWLAGLGDVGKIPLATILGGMTAFDMGGPVNKVATLFAQTQVDTLPYLMGGVGVAICTPPIGMGLATLLAPKKYNTEEREAGKGALLMGCVGITEGAIPFAANDPLRVIPSIMVGAI
ncbi:PTS fructose transporter subunit IIC, partial [Clostridium perfringens]|nr:PTS fructose transporter subunit IIC [Clostridium perfringens]